MSVQDPILIHMATKEEIGEAILDAARYGDEDDLKELTQTYGLEHLNYQDSENTTALHKGTAAELLNPLNLRHLK